MKVAILEHLQDGPAGGGKNFIKRLRDEFDRRGKLAELDREADILLINSFSFSHRLLLTRQIYALKRNKPSLRIVHRVDGPVSMVRGNLKEYYIDDYINNTNIALADGTIFQSEYSKRKCLRYGFTNALPAATIWNAASSKVHKVISKEPYKNGRLRIVMTSWSSNWKKGFETLKYLDNNLDFNKFEMCFYGNSPVQFRNITHHSAIETSELQKALNSFDVFVAASFDEPCSNSLIEGISAGLVPLARNDGGNRELVGDKNFLFNSNHELLNKLVEINENGATYTTLLCSIEGTADKYLDFFDKLAIRSAKKVKAHTLVQNEIKFYTAKSRIKLGESSIIDNNRLREEYFDDYSQLEAEIWYRLNKIPSYLYKNWQGLKHPKYGDQGDLYKDNLQSSVFTSKMLYMLGSDNEQTQRQLIENISSFFKAGKGIYDEKLLLKPTRLKSRFYKFLKGIKHETRTSFIIAETRQSLAALMCLNEPLEMYKDVIYQNYISLENIIGTLNWDHPWDAGAQFSHYCFFSSLCVKQGLINERNNNEFIINYLKMLQKKDGFWYTGRPTLQQKLNGAMKVITGLNCLKLDIPTEHGALYSGCISNIAQGHACNKFNVMYVLSNLNSVDYNNKKFFEFIVNFFNTIEQHYWYEMGAYSFNPRTANKYYYERKINVGGYYPDIHGTMLMSYALVQILKVIESKYYKLLREPYT